jgi:ribosomal protein L13E
MSSIVLCVVSLSGQELASIEADASSTLADILDQLLEANECRICTLIYNDIELSYLNVTGLPSHLHEFSFQPGTNIATAIFKTKQWLEELGISPAMLMKTDSDSRAHRTLHNLKSYGYSVRELRATGYNALELRACLEATRGVSKRDAQLMDANLAPNCPARLLKNGGFTLTEMLQTGYTATTLKDLGFTFASFMEANVSPSEIAEAGFTALEFLEHGWSLAQLQKLSFKAGQLRRSQYFPKQLKEAGYTAEQLKTAGYSLAQLKEIFNLAELKQAGYTAWVLAKAGFGVKELEDAGFTSKELTDAGFLRPASTLRRQSATLIRAA